MVELLLPVSGANQRESALKIAAELDRMAIIRMFLAANTPLRKAVAEWDSLLVAAASGAALEVGQWLLSEPPVPISQDELQGALRELYDFVVKKGARTPRALAFAKLLVAHGADINAPFRGKATLLHESIAPSHNGGRMARLLIAAGADPLRLSGPERDRLDSLLAEPGDDWFGRYGPIEGCITP